MICAGLVQGQTCNNVCRRTSSSSQCNWCVNLGSHWKSGILCITPGSPNCTETRVDIQPKTKDSTTIPVDEGFTNRGNWNITSTFFIAFLRALPLDQMSWIQMSLLLPMPNFSKLCFSYPILLNSGWVHCREQASLLMLQIIGHFSYEWYRISLLIIRVSFSFVTTATNVTIRNTEITPVPDKHCIGTVTT